MLVIFKGDPIELERGSGLSRTSITIEGVTFYLNQAVDASALSDRVKQKLRNNHHFEVMSAAAPPASAPAAEAPAEVGDDAAEDAETAAHVERAANKRKK